MESHVDSINLEYIRYSFFIEFVMSTNTGQDGVQQQLEGSQTISLEEAQPVLQLRAEEPINPQRQESRSPASQRPSVRWQSDVIDNENMNKKKTKICCIFHPQQEFDFNEEHSDHDCSSSSSSSSSSSESESEKHLDFNERRQRRVARRHRILAQNKSKSPNAYEIQPDYNQDRSRRQHHH